MIKLDLSKFKAIFLIFIIVSGCEHFNKLTGKTDKPSTATKEKATSLKKPATQNKAIKKTVQKLDHKTYRYQVERLKVWKAILDIISPDYNVTVVDLKSGIITTDWDRYYLDGKAFRNRITLRTKRVGKKETTLIINNKVERLKDNNWLPSKKESEEVNRIVYNLSKMLGQILPPQ
jgi:hypothetical protein